MDSRTGGGKMKERVTLTIEKELLSQIDAKVDGSQVKNRSHAVELYLRRALRGRVPSKALILAGGKSEKMQPLTKTTPKSMIKIQGKPMLEHNIELLKRFGITDIIISVGYLKEQIIDYFMDGATFGVTITYIEEDAQNPLGTAGPIKKAKKYLDESSFLVLNADELKDINLEKLYKEHLRNEAAATIALTTVKDPSEFGVAMLDGNHILRFVEKPPTGTAPSKLINAGLYIFEPSVIDMIPEGFAKLETDLFPKLAGQGKLVGYPFSGQWANPETPEWISKIEEEWEGFKG
jgi:NDP-sugar pyrophosphorylase family protein